MDGFLVPENDMEMDKLELKHLAPYLPYGLKIKTKHGIDTMETLNEFCVNGDCEEWYSYEDHPEEVLQFKPILRPLSDLTKEIECNVDFYFPNDGYLELIARGIQHINHCPYPIFIKLLERHFDVFELIEKGLAIDINTLEK
ncbi:MAG: hypothetical protein ACQ9ET_00110 [Nitrosomonadaceae bacterium]